ncbi:hypothetical protein DW322_19510 [Rhodococcus rhodnii]|uniref:Uncharacterized protein n=1 Tax=Rhodococcus rhodnii TaxID=38312 RepID=A0A6P2CHB5_9NOCA|nr:hypothetical protein DW322_19510 [Rhodococcus rhodnii]
MPPRPRIVDAAYAVWLLSTLVLVVQGLVGATTSGETLRDQLVAGGVDDPGAFTVAVRIAGVVAVVVGLVIGALAGPVRAGHRGFRPVAVGISVVYAAAAFVAVAVGFATVIWLLAPILLLVAVALATMPPARRWYREAEAGAGTTTESP